MEGSTPPLTSAPRIVLHVGQHVSVTRLDASPALTPVVSASLGARSLPCRMLGSATARWDLRSSILSFAAASCRIP